MTVTICRGPVMKVIRDEPNGNPRWCFICRKVREFRFIVKAPAEPSYYGPDPEISCAECGRTDGDMFPDGYREWDI